MFEGSLSRRTAGRTAYDQLGADTIFAPLRIAGARKFV
jgi:hypothetical protein